MGSSSSQGIVLLVFLAAFTFLGWGMFLDGNFLLVVLAVLTLVASVALFMKAKALDGVR
jgi:hypothetical protein